MLVSQSVCRSVGHITPSLKPWKMAKFAEICCSDSLKSKAKSWPIDASRVVQELSKSCPRVIQSCPELSRVTQSCPEPLRVTRKKWETDRWMDGRRDTPSYRDARTHLKTSNGRGRWWKIFPQIDSLDAQWKDELNKPRLKFGAFSVVIWWPWFVSANSEDCQNLKLARYF